MCPVCASTLAWLAFGGASVGGLGAFLIKRKGKGDGNDRTDP
jgi:hypothetical protein